MPRLSRHFFTRVTLLALSLACCQASRAGSVSWNCAIFSTNLNSAGANLDATYVFELGGFKNNFVPTSANTANWAENWVAADRTPYVPSNSPIPGRGHFLATHDVTTNASPFGTSQKGYIWGYKCTAASAGEWILLTNETWTWPFASGLVNKTWGAGSADDVIVGQTNGSGFLMKTAAVTGSPLPTVTPAVWISSHFSPAEQTIPSICAWESDADGDGATNALEYATGKNPRDPASSWSPVPAFENDNNGHPHLAISISLDPRAKVVVTAQSSGNLSDWTQNPPLVTTDQLDLFAVRDALAINQAAKRFLRFRVTVQQ